MKNSKSKMNIWVTERYLLMIGDLYLESTTNQQEKDRKIHQQKLWVGNSQKKPDKVMKSCSKLLVLNENKLPRYIPQIRNN